MIIVITVHDAELNSSQTLSFENPSMILVGRAGDNDIVLEDERVNHHQVMIDVNGTQLNVTESRVGGPVLLNDMPIGESAPFGSGDRLSIAGRFILYWSM